MHAIRRIGRRRFFRASALGAIGAGLTAGRVFAREPGNPAVPQADSPRIREHRVLGRTGFRVSDLACGSSMDEGVLRAALEAGMNYIDSAEQYPGHHRTIAGALRGLDRKSIFITTKLEIDPEKPSENTKEVILRRARKCLEELRTDYVDCLMMHFPEKVETLTHEGFHAAMAELKTEGRVRFVGVSHHGSFWYLAPANSMESILMAAIEDGRFDVVLLAYNFLRMDGSEKVLAACRERKVGTALMKATPIAIFDAMKERVEKMRAEGKTVSEFYAEGLRRYTEKVEVAQEFIRTHNLRNRDEIRDAAIRFVLGNPDVGTVCVLVRTYADLEAFLRLSGTRLDTAARTKLSDYATGCGALYCRHACGVCEPSCPHAVPVNTIMRYFQYFAGQGREREAMGYYADIPGARADICRDCPGHCERACPHGVPIQGMLLAAHDRLSMP